MFAILDLCEVEGLFAKLVGSGCNEAVDCAAGVPAFCVAAPLVAGTRGCVGRFAPAAFAWLIGCVRFVDKFRISLP